MPARRKKPSSTGPFGGQRAPLTWVWEDRKGRWGWMELRPSLVVEYLILLPYITVYVVLYYVSSTVWSDSGSRAIPVSGGDGHGLWREESDLF